MIIFLKYFSEISLNGEWNLRNVNGSINISGKVPGQVHMDLLNAKIINDPYFNDHVLEYKSCFLFIDKHGLHLKIGSILDLLILHLKQRIV